MATTISNVVKSKYGAVAESSLSSNDKGVKAVAEAFGYSTEELSSIPAEANMGLSCGNPTAMASLKPGEVVVDLGCGGGIDVFLAAQRVGPTGKAIGIDITPAMIERAKRNSLNGPGGEPYTNVEFHLATIDKMPLPDASVDVVISNCVINLAPDKPAVFREIARVLRPGGRVAVSDIALKKPLPPEIATDVAAYVGCIAGATLIDVYVKQLIEAGFDHVQVIDGGADLNAYAKVEGQSGCCSPRMEQPQASSTCCTTPKVSEVVICCTPKAAKDASSSCCTPNETAAGGECCTPKQPDDTKLHDDLGDLLKRYDVNAYAASVKVLAVRG